MGVNEMSKKYKSLLKFLIISMIFITIIALFRNVYSSYNPTREEFKNAETSSLLGKKLEFNGTLWKELDSSGQLSCFYHNQAAYNMMAEIYIHSVFDVGFDDQEGRMKVYSIVNDANKTSKTTYASDKNTSVGYLAAQAARSGNAYGVYTALRKAMDEKTIVQDATIINKQEWWPDNVKNAETNQDLINLYSNYKKISKEETKYNLVENTDDVSLNNKEYTVIGPLKVTFGGKDINKITVGNASWTSNSRDSIYWSTDKKSWSNDFNKGTTAKYDLNNKEFYLAVETTKLPDDGKYKISMEQNKFEYRNSRTIICTSVYAQQTGMYCYDNNPTPVVGKVEWEVERIPTDKSLIIEKKDNKTGEKITGAGFKIYAVLANGTKGWVSGSKDADKKYESKVDNATEYSDDVEIKKLKFGEYYVFETKAPEGYELENQENYKKAKDGIPTPTGEWVYVGSKTLNKKSSKTVKYDVTNIKEILLATKIIKIDGETNQEISGGKFKVYAVIDDKTKGWVAGNASDTKTYETDATKAWTYDSNTNIENLRSGTYYYFETKGPEGYNMKKQTGYMKTDASIPDIKPADSEYVYLGSKVIPKDADETVTYDFTAINTKSVDKIEGTVWLDVPDGKLDKIDNIYKSGTKDTLLEGIDVTLYDNNGAAIANTTTDKNGYYSFTEKNASTYKGENKNLLYSEISEGYVEFVYDNEKYICVDILAGEDAKYNSKAQESTITTVKLDDNNIANKVEGAYPGKAVTDKEITALTKYYDSKTCTISNINLGLTEKLKPEFSITEDVAYMKVQFGDYAYRYEYMKDDDQLKRTTVPTVNQQVSARTFTAKIYPSDVAYNIENSNSDNGLKVYMVYRINVFNNTPHNYVNNYYEEKMYIESLTNAFDARRYVLSNDKHSIDDQDAIKDFDYWSAPNSSASSINAVATYNCKGTWRNQYHDGVKTEFDEDGNIIEGKEGYVTTYIQYQLTESSVKKILAKKLTEDDVVKAPSTAEATTFHEYWRTDNVWEDGKEKYYEGHKQENYKEPTTSNKTHYLHKSESQTKQAAQLWMRFDLPEKERTLSGVVFEDTVTENSKKENKKLGNGIKENTENTVSKVKVELVNSKEATEAVDLYEYAPDTAEKYKISKADTTVEEGGEFEFKGVIPGMYYLRFTYGDGTQRLYDSNGKIVKVKDKDGKETNEDVSVSLYSFGSTIIDSSTDDGKKIQAAMEAKEGDNSKAEWYKDITGENYSTAVDSIAQRSELNGYIYNADGTIEDKDGNKIKPRTSINAYTPKISVTIENDKDEQRMSTNAIDYKAENDTATPVNTNYYEYKGFNFGIIYTPSEIIPEKTISNVALKDQTGTMIVSADPKDKTASYITALDETATLVKAEIAQEQLYGSEVEATYKITITNASPIDYVEPEDSKTYGYYYKYGELTDDATEKKVTIKEVEDNIDGQYKADSVKVVGYYIDGTKKNSNITISTPAGEKQESTETIEESEDGTVTKTNTLKISGWSEGIKSTQSETVEYTANALLGSENEDEDGLINNAQITKLKLDKLTTLSSSSVWDKSTTTLSITPPTGYDRANTYYIAGAIALIVLASGIVIIRKRVLK